MKAPRNSNSSGNVAKSNTQFYSHSRLTWIVWPLADRLPESFPCGSAVAFSTVSGHLLADLATLQTDINALSSLPAINATAHYAQQKKD
jgi:hypothetical protein